MLTRKASAQDIIQRASCQRRGEQVPSRASTEEEEIQVRKNPWLKKAVFIDDNTTFISVDKGSLCWHATSQYQQCGSKMHLISLVSIA